MNLAGNPRGPSINSLRPKGGIGGRNKSNLDDKLGNNIPGNALELNFYASPPSYELSLDEFEDLALARLKVRTTILWQ
jgi:hypothetical protein